MEYAGFWRRFGAAFIDGILVSIVSAILRVLLNEIVAELISLVGYYVYFAWMESSDYQGTVGKLAIGIKVTDLEGNKISFGRALGRNLAKLLSALILLIGYIMAAFTERKQALHDIIASTLVIKRAPAASPGATV
jgi:uncharacterized RDD family membrane protein YckC